MSGKAIDLTGHRYGRWTVLYRNGTDKHNYAVWRCRCDCGQEKDVSSAMLRQGKSQSCGCLRKERAAEAQHARRIYNIQPGDRYGHLVVTQLNNNSVTCICDCGNYTTVRRDHLYTGNTSNCGCRSWFKSPVIKEEVGNKYGLLTILEKTQDRDEKGNVIWLCRCDCGKTKKVAGTLLRRGLVSSCGCLKSKGEYKIRQILEDLDISFQQQKYFKDLKNDNSGNYLYFDFYLPDYNILIEYQGEQHYKASGESGWNTQEYFKNLQYRDNLKRKYCKEHNIYLLEIPYTDYNDLDKDYFLDKIGGLNENHNN